MEYTWGLKQYNMHLCKKIDYNIKNMHNSSIILLVLCKDNVYNFNIIHKRRQYNGQEKHKKSSSRIFWRA